MAFVRVTLGPLFAGFLNGENTLKGLRRLVIICCQDGSLRHCATNIVIGEGGLRDCGFPGERKRKKVAVEVPSNK